MIECDYDSREQATHIFLFGCPSCDYTRELYICQNHLRFILDNESTHWTTCRRTIQSIHSTRGNRFYEFCGTPMEYLWQPIRPDFHPHD